MPSQDFISRHIGPTAAQVHKMLDAIGCTSLEALSERAIPASIRMAHELDLPVAKGEYEALEDLKIIAKENQVFKNYIGIGYSDCVTPPVILRNILENPGWYTQYTPYQSEISQGRLEALLNFQTLICDLTALPVSNASLLDEATAAAEAMSLCLVSNASIASRIFYVAQDCHPQTIEVIRTRAEPLDIEIKVLPTTQMGFDDKPFGVLLQYPGTHGHLIDYSALIQSAHAHGALVTMACDLLGLTLLTAPGELGADIAVGCSQRFGVSLGFGGPHAAFLSTKEDFKRLMPGRLIGVSKDAQGHYGYRLALQTREQHIRREKATSNICTAQVLLAIMASMYAVYHGPSGLRAIALEIHRRAGRLAKALTDSGFKLATLDFFDTLQILTDPSQQKEILARAKSAKINLRIYPNGALGVSLHEAMTEKDLADLAAVFNVKKLASEAGNHLPVNLNRKSDYLTHPVFHRHQSETQMLRYIKKLESRDLSLGFSMIPLGSCTMKLNATSELIPVTWPEFSSIHPFAPKEQSRGYEKMHRELEAMLCEITGFDATSLQPNAGSQGEYAGLLVIRKFHLSREEGHRKVCLIPRSAHGTNPASASMAGMNVVVVECDSQGNVDLGDLQKKAREHARDLAALMITYPSTHGVFETGIKKICEIVHQYGGQVYMDGANMNAQVGLCRPGDFGPDVCHLNLHKTFCIPHGGGGPGMGPICVKKHLAGFLPGHSVTGLEYADSVGAVSAAPYGSASILPISWMYIRMMGASGLKQATQIAILNANYVAQKLAPHFPVLYKGESGLVAHECIIDLRPLKASSGVEVEDVAKRLMDYGFHAPTVSFPVAGTMMIEPTESEDLEELDRFCEAMIAIRGEIAQIESGKMDRKNNPLKNAPHPASILIQENWDRPYSREQAAYPLPWIKEHKFWPAVARIDNVYGDRNLICTCPPIDAYSSS